MMINPEVYIFIDIILMIIAAVIAVIISLIDDDNILIIKYEENTKIFKSIKEIKKDVGASAFEAVSKFESDLNKIIIVLYPNCKIIKNTLKY